MQNKYNENHMSITKLNEIAKKIAKEALCQVNATVHIYRKTFASVQYRRTGNILLVLSCWDMQIQGLPLNSILSMKSRI